MSRLVRFLPEALSTMGPLVGVMFAEMGVEALLLLLLLLAVAESTAAAAEAAAAASRSCCYRENVIISRSSQATLDSHSPHLFRDKESPPCL